MSNKKADSDKIKTKISNAIRVTSEGIPDEYVPGLSEKSEVNFPKCFGVKTNDLKKISILDNQIEPNANPIQTNRKIKKKRTKGPQDIDIHNQIEKIAKIVTSKQRFFDNVSNNTCNESPNYKNSTKAREETYREAGTSENFFSSVISISSNAILTKRGKNISKKSNGMEFSLGSKDSEKQKVSETFNERSVFDQLNQLEGKDHMENMDNLDNLSNILKNKNDKLPKLDKNLNSENLFLYRNITANTSKGKSQSGLNKGFIMEDNKDINNLNSHTLSRGSTPSLHIQNSESSQVKTESDKNREIKSTKTNRSTKYTQECRITEISKKIENLKHTSHKKEKKKNENKVQLTCFQKFCQG